MKTRYDEFILEYNNQLNESYIQDIINNSKKINFLDGLKYIYKEVIDKHLDKFKVWIQIQKLINEKIPNDLEKNIEDARQEIINKIIKNDIHFIRKDRPTNSLEKNRNFVSSKEELINHIKYIPILPLDMKEYLGKFTTSDNTDLIDELQNKFPFLYKNTFYKKPNTDILDTYLILININTKQNQKNIILHELYHYIDMGFNDIKINKIKGLNDIFDDKDYTLYNKIKNKYPNFEIIDKYLPRQKIKSANKNDHDSLIKKYDEYIFNNTELFPRIQNMYYMMIKYNIIKNGDKLNEDNITKYILFFYKMIKNKVDDNIIDSNEMIPFIFKINLNKIDQLNDYIIK